MRWAWIAVAALGLGGCGGPLSATNPLSPTRARISVTSPAFAPGRPIPSRFTCQGADVSPPIALAGVPKTAQALGLVMRDPDAPGGNFIHWQLTGIAPATRTIGSGRIPPGARAGRNDFGSLGYRGPCPPTGPAHHYVITVTATSGAATVGVGVLTGTYARR